VGKYYAINLLGLLFINPAGLTQRASEVANSFKSGTRFQPNQKPVWLQQSALSRLAQKHEPLVSIGRFYQLAASETEADVGSVRLLTGKFPETGVKRIFSGLKDRKLSIKNQVASGYQVCAEKIRGTLNSKHLSLKKERIRLTFKVRL